MGRLVGTLLFVSLSQCAYACSCGDPGPACYAIGNPRLAAVFVARAENIVRNGDEAIVTMNVTESFRGNASGTVKVLTAESSATCGYDFEQGEDYLVWAFPAGDTSDLRVSLCSRTRTLQQAGADLEYLRTVSYRSENSWIFGDAMQYTFDPDFKRDPRASRHDPNLAPEDARRIGEAADRPMKPMTGSTVVAVDANGRLYRSAVDADGQYRIENLPPGRYLVRVDAPRTMLLSPEQQQFDLKPRGCGQVDFRAQMDGRISGVITDEEGSPDRLAVQLSDPKHPKNTERFFTTTTDKDGRFEFKGLPAGEYVLYLERRRNGPCDPDTCSDLTFYPGVRRQEDATLIKLGEAQKLTGLNVKLLPPRKKTP